MLRFAFKPRHPITRVAFTADGREIITAQPFTGIAVRDRLTGVARVTFPMAKAVNFGEIASHPTSGLIAVGSGRGVVIFDPHAQEVRPLFGQGQRHNLFGVCERGFRIVHGSGQYPWSENSVWFGVWEFASPDSIHPPAPFPLTNIRIMAHMAAVSPDARLALCLRRDTRPIIASLPNGDVVAAVSSPLRGTHHFRGHSIIAFSPDGSRLVLGVGESLAVFELSGVPRELTEAVKQKVVHPLFTLERPDPTQHGTFADKQAEYWLPPVAFDHAGRTMFTLGLRNRVQRIDLATGGVMGEWGWRCEPIRSLAVAPDDLTAAAGCQRGELVLWDLE